MATRQTLHRYKWWWNLGQVATRRISTGIRLSERHRNKLPRLDPVGESHDQINDKNVFVNSCPPPTFDTGCTHCHPDPQNYNIDYSKPLANTTAPHRRHILLCTGTHDWPSKIEAVPGSLAHDLATLRRKKLLIDSHFPVLMSNCDLPSLTPGKTTALIYPDNIMITNLTSENAQDFLLRYMVGPKFWSEHNIHAHPHRFTSLPVTTRLIGICGHRARDIRCGLIAPLLIDEFKSVLSVKSLLYDDNNSSSDKIRLTTLSHIGGHAYAGNVLYFTHSGQSIWYGRVQCENVQGIVSETIQSGKIIQPLYRGGLIPPLPQHKATH